jgi:hypothetical protein
MDAEEVADLVRQLAEEQRRATLLEVAQIRAVYAERGLPQSVTQRVQQKYERHVEQRAEWHDVMDVFGHLVASSDDGRLDDGDRHDLRAIAADLALALPALERMRLRKPDADLLARLRLAAAS